MSISSILIRKFGQKYDTSLNIAKFNMINTLYSEYFELDDIYKFWRFQQDISNKFDLSECINNPSYLDTKESYYKNNVKKIEKILE